MISGGGVFYPITITDGVYDITNNQRLSTTLTGKADKATTYTKTEVDNIVGDCAYIGDDDGSAVMVDPPITPESIGFGYGVCSTAAGTAAKVVTMANYELVVNGFVAVSFENDVPANATLNINGAGAKPIYYKGEAIVENAISGGDTVTFVYDGTNYVVATPLKVNKVTIRTWGDNAKTTPIAGVLSVTLPGKTATTVRTGSAGTATVYSVDGRALVSSSGADSDISSFSVNGDTVVDIVLSDIDYIDLGLPSGLLWAKGNLKKVDENTYKIEVVGGNGSYFAGGELTGYNVGESHTFDLANYSAVRADGTILPDNTIFASGDPTYDAAAARLGNGWRMPTPDETKELVNKCSHIVVDSATTGYSTKAMRLTGPNGNTLDFIINGWWDNTSINTYGVAGAIRGTSIIQGINTRSDGSCFVSGIGGKQRGLSIRPVI